MTSHSTKPSAYKAAGVDIDAGADLVEKIKGSAAKTQRPGVMDGLGGFGALFDLKAAGYNDPILVSGTDGVGTKLKVAIETGQHSTVGIDLVAMCVNDLVVQGAEPLFFLDYFGSGKLDVDHARDVITGIAKGCERSGCALIGGETAELPGLYADGDYDLAGFCVGAVDRDKIMTGDRIRSGDIILGLASDGVHSNGFSLVRKLAEQNGADCYTKPAPFDPDKSLGESLLTPTRLYVKSCLAAAALNDENGQQMVKGLAHITGGGLIENLPRILPKGLGADVDAHGWDLPPVFRWLIDQGNLTSHDMGTTFNSGIGMVVICSPSNMAKIRRTLKENGETVFTIGHITDQEGVTITNAAEAWNTAE